MAITFKPVFDNMQAGLAQAAQAEVTFEATTRLGGGLDSQATIRQFTLTADEPPALGGQDRGPNPVEYILAALGSCQEITYRLYADAMGIPLAGVSVKIRGVLDLRGFFAVDDGVRPGYQRIEAEVTLESPASAEDLRRLREQVDRHCPVLDMLQNPVPVATSLRIEAPATVD